MSNKDVKLVAVYGSLKENYSNHRLLEAATFKGVDTQEGWTMLSLGGFPGIIAGESTIAVEVYEVNEQEMENLDRLEGFPHFYNRKIVQTIYGDAWIYYLSNPEEYNTCTVVESGVW